MAIFGSEVYNDPRVDEPLWMRQFTNRADTQALADKPLPNPGNGSNWLNNGTADSYAYLLDQLGKRIAPNNPMAGLGSQMAQQNVMSRTMEKNKKQQDFIGNLALRALMGDIPLTPQGVPGLTKMSVVPGKDGSPHEVSFSGTLAAKRAREMALENPQVDSSDTPPQESLYQADPRLSWADNMNRMDYQKTLRDFVNNGNDTYTDPAMSILPVEVQKVLADERGKTLNYQHGVLSDVNNMRVQANKAQAEMLREIRAQKEAQYKAAIDARKEARQARIDEVMIKLHNKDISLKEAELALKPLRAQQMQAQTYASTMQGKSAGTSAALHAEQLRQLSDPENIALRDMEHDIKFRKEQETLRGLQTTNDLKELQFKEEQDPEIKAAEKRRKLLLPVQTQAQIDRLQGVDEGLTPIQLTKMQDNAESMRSSGIVKSSQADADRYNSYGMSNILYFNAGTAANPDIQEHSFRFTDPELDAQIDSAYKFSKMAQAYLGLSTKPTARQLENFVKKVNADSIAKGGGVKIEVKLSKSSTFNRSRLDLQELDQVGTD